MTCKKILYILSTVCCIVMSFMFLAQDYTAFFWLTVFIWIGLMSNAPMRDDAKQEDLDFLWRWIERLKRTQTTPEQFISVVWHYPNNPIKDLEQ